MPFFRVSFSPIFLEQGSKYGRFSRAGCQKGTFSLEQVIISATVLLICPNLFNFLVDFAAYFGFIRLLLHWNQIHFADFSGTGYRFQGKILKQVRILLWWAHPRIKKSSTPPPRRKKSEWLIDVLRTSFGL